MASLIEIDNYQNTTTTKIKKSKDGKNKKNFLCVENQKSTELCYCY